MASHGLDINGLAKKKNVKMNKNHLTSMEKKIDIGNGNSFFNVSHSCKYLIKFKQKGRKILRKNAYFSEFPSTPSWWPNIKCIF